MDGRDKTMFSILAQEHTGMLLTYLRAIVNDPATVDDIFQETMITAWRRLNSYDRSRPFARWLRGIARKLVLAHFRKAQKVPLPCDDEILEYLEQRMVQIDKRSGDTWQEKIEALKDCIDALPVDFRRAIELHYRENLKTEEISERTKSTKEAIKKRLQRARASLAECLQRKGVLEPLLKKRTP